MNHEREGSNIPQLPKMKPLWKMKRWFKIGNDFRWAMMVGLGMLWRFHWGPIRVDLIHVFFLGIKSVDEMEIKAIVHGQKVKLHGR